MPAYDFVKLLSPIDFELLSKDLLEAELGLALENFREGKDGGIDLRHSTDGNGSTIIQCKRYGQFAALKSELSNKELPKIKRLKPLRYILTTSVAVSPQQADELKTALHPFIATTGDIYGADRLNALLAKHEMVERRHLKLWLSSAGVLETLLHAKTHVVSSEEVHRTLASAKIYVANPSFNEALTILHRERVCIIAGQPGIGKTTLARMLLLHYFRQEFDIIKIESDISEARDVGYHERPRFYFYDDFLGQTGQADKLNKNEDQKLLDFIRAVRESKNSVFVLTTREYILNQAKLHYEKLDREKFAHETCTVDLTKYSRRLRAQILYNHLHFSNLPAAFRTALLAGQSHRKVVDHPHYNPRLIETLTNEKWIQAKTPAEYAVEFIGGLNDPSAVWAHAYHNQLSCRAQHLLTVLTTLPYEVVFDDLKLAFDLHHRAQCDAMHLPQAAGDFRVALKELDGTFVTSRMASDKTLVRFCNPSIRDFMKRQVLSEETLPGLLINLVFFEQAQWFSGVLAETEPRVPVDSLQRQAGAIARTMLEKALFGSCAIAIRGKESFSRLQPTPADRVAPLAVAGARVHDAEISAFIREQIQAVTNELKDGAQQVEAAWISALPILKQLGYLQSSPGANLVEELKLMLKDNMLFLTNYERLAQFVKALPGVYTEPELETIRAEFTEFAWAYTDEQDSDDPHELRDDAERIERIASELEADPVGADDLRVRARDVERESKLNSEDPPIIYRLPRDEFSDLELDSMFKTLA